MRIFQLFTKPKTKMEIKMIFVYLIFPFVTALYSETQSPENIIPEFSTKMDICKAIGKSLEVNCSIHDTHEQSQLLLVHNCSSKGNQSSNATHSTPFNMLNNCSDSESRRLSTFDIKGLQILHCTSSDRNSCVPKETTEVTEKTVSLSKNNLSEADTGTYFCQYNNVAQTEDNFDLTVLDYPDGPGVITCVSMDLTDLNCSWTKSQSDSNYNSFYKSYFKIRPYYDTKYNESDCPSPQPNPGKFRDDEGCKLSSDKFYLLNDYILCINMTNCLGTWTHPHKVLLREIVKFSPPIVTSVHIEESKIQMTLNLNFNTQRALKITEEILYHVTYTSAYSTQVKDFNSSLTNNIPVDVSSLIPSAKYHVTITIRGPDTVGDRYWSRSVTNSYTTKPTAPVAVPNVPTGGFSMHSGSLNIYLKPISRKDKYAANASYKVNVRNGSGTTIRVFNASWDTTTLENVTGLHGGSDYKITITTNNEFGESQNATKVTVPAAILEPGHINVIAERSGNNYTVLWNTEKIDEIEKELILVYWCFGIRNNNFCKSDLNWISISNAQNNITLPDLTDKLEGEWLFAVSYQYIDGYNTGMVFAKCYFSSSNDAPSAVEPFNVLVTSPTEIQVTPLLYCKYTNRPLKFIVYYKEAENNINSCDKTFHEKVVTANIETNSITVRNLKKSTKYAVCLSVVTEAGFHTSDVQLVQMNEADLKLLYIIPSVIVAVFVLAAGLLSIWKCKKTMQKPLPIELPKIIQRKYEKVLDSKNDYSRTKQESYSSDSGVTSNTVSSDVTISNATTDGNDLTNDVDETKINITHQNSPYTATTGIAKEINILPNRHGIIQTENQGKTENQTQKSIDDKAHLMSDVSYRKLTFTNSEIGDLDHCTMSIGYCTESSIKEDVYKMLENVSSNMTVIDPYVTSNKQTHGTSLSNSNNYISTENDFDMRRYLLREGNFNQPDILNEYIQETESSHLNPNSTKRPENSNVSPYMQLGV